jgi:lysophospholipase L1-like esterase
VDSGAGGGTDGGGAVDGASHADAGVADSTAPPGDAGNPAGGGNVGPNPDPATLMICTGTSPIACHFGGQPVGGQPGNYAVTVELGGATAAKTEVIAETSRGMLGFVSTAAGVTARYSFVVNVRQPEGQPAEAVPPGTPGLDLYFYGSDGFTGQDAGVGGNILPQLAGIGIAEATNPVIVYIASDSTACDQTDTDFSGWGQMLPQYFNYPVSIANYADSGESSASFLGNAKLWGAIDSRIATGDWVLIQFGHNDKTTTATAFHNNITSMVTQAVAKGAHPVLISPPARANGQPLSAQFVYTTPLDVRAEMQAVSTEQKVPYIDLTATTSAWYGSLPANGWKAYHADGTDETHTNVAGATVIAGYVATAMKTQAIGLAPYLR